MPVKNKLIFRNLLKVGVSQKRKPIIVSGTLNTLLILIFNHKHSERVNAASRTSPSWRMLNFARLTTTPQCTIYAPYAYARKVCAKFVSEFNENRVARKPPSCCLIRRVTFQARWSGARGVGREGDERSRRRRCVQCQRVIRVRAHVAGAIHSVRSINQARRTDRDKGADGARQFLLGDAAERCRRRGRPTSRRAPRASPCIRRV